MALDTNPAELIELAHDYPVNHPARLALLTEAIAVGVAFLVMQATPSVSDAETDPAPGPVAPDPVTELHNETASVPAPPTPRRRPKPTKSTESTDTHAPPTP